MATHIKSESELLRLNWIIRQKRGVFSRNCGRIISKTMGIIVCFSPPLPHFFLSICKTFFLWMMTDPHRGMLMMVNEDPEMSEETRESPGVWRRSTACCSYGEHFLCEV
uniref:(northern house mosquito) hypothetical protein n=1 Tax=Culex pipiens TaxID=7175 RepID=A0A8D8ERG3_CULPI